MSQSQNQNQTQNQDQNQNQNQNQNQIQSENQIKIVGDVPNVAFPCASLVDAPTGRIAIYYGAAGTVTALAFGYVADIIHFVKNNSRVK
ncbi:hypothetical protein [Paenibacillus sp. 481]|uniref:glycoside hydrolase family 130 protein n=1 Tax=Paenibacillus sp. 481 TaxID=2835869 RepID=UPI003FA7A515|nr:hypothetical protein KIK04_08630 [Paenibacillus sp. 481]